MDLSEFLPLLKGVKPCRNGYLAHCPAHEDNKQSLQVGEGKDGRILVHCHAGCSVNDVCRAVGIEIRDLFPREKPRGKAPVITAYDYYDTKGNLLFQVCRTSEKGFFQRRPDGNGGWTNGLGGVKPVLYQLPEVEQAIKAGRTIYIPEGEKDCGNLAALGLTATTNPMGAGKWRSQYTESLKGATVVILPDNDEPGRKHGLQVARSLYTKSGSVKVLKLPDLPEKGDVTDWLNNGGTKEKLLQLVQGTPEWQPPKSTSQVREKEEERKVKQKSFLLGADNILLEQVYSNRQNTFMAFNMETEEVRTIPYIDTGEEIIEPMSGEDVELGAVKIPSGVEEYDNTLSLLDKIEKHIHRYLDVSPSYLRFASYYVLLTWVYDRFHTLPYLRALGDTGCGKSRFLDVIGGLCYKAISASGCVTPAPIYRMLRRWGGTLVLDEADMKNSDEYNEVVTILNCGFEKGRPVIRATKDNPDKVQILPVYGPKVFATRRRFKDAALEARCLTEVMEETDRDDIPPVLGQQFFREQEGLRNKLLLFRFRNYFKVDPEAGAAVNLGNIEPRLKQVSESFLSLFATEQQVLESYKGFIYNHQQELIEQRAATRPGQVVEVLFDLLEGYEVTMVTTPMGDRAVNVTAGMIAERVGITPQATGQILKTLGLRTYPLKVEGKTRKCLVYDEARFNKLKRRYILDNNEVTADYHNTRNCRNLVTEKELTPSQQRYLEGYERGEYDA